MNSNHPLQSSSHLNIALGNLLRLSAALILVFLLVGCSQPQSAQNPPTSLPPATTQLPPPATPTPAPPPTQTPTPAPTATATPAPSPTLALPQKFGLFPWIDYAPTNFNPDSGLMPSFESIAEDLRVLYEAGFRGIVTYEAGGVFAEIPRLAHEAGFEGVLMGVWMPGDEAETQAAVNAAPFVDGYVVGNEGLYFDRYEFPVLAQAIDDLRQKTGKPVTTTEVLSLYNDPELIGLGDWLFPNAHPYWQSITDPEAAVNWTVSIYDSLLQKAPQGGVVLKEVGLPTAGDQKTSEYQQAEYYARLRDTHVRFMYFEAFDQPWKAEDGVGAHWGLFNSDRSAKAASRYISRGYPPIYVYADWMAPHNHFVPEGFMGCYQGIDMDEKDTSSPYSGSTSIKITYTPLASCKQKWAGVYWWDPPGGDWCRKEGGYDLTGWTKLTFWARGENGGEPVEFKVGGLMKPDGQACDSIVIPYTTDPMTLTDTWTQYSISLYGADLSHIAGGFVWVTNSEDPITLYLDEIRFEWSER